MGSIISYTQAMLDTLLNAKVSLADAVSLSTATPGADTPTGFAGTANTAARGDHVHPTPPATATGLAVANEFLPGRITGTAYTPVLGRVYLQPYPVFTINHAGLTVTGLSTIIGTAGSADSTLKVALYRPGSDGWPDFTNGIVPSTTIATGASTGEVIATLGASVAVPDGWYWKAVLVNGTTSPAFKSQVDVPSPYMRNPSVVDQYSKTRMINATVTVLPTTNPQTLSYETANDILPLVLVVA